MDLNIIESNKRKIKVFLFRTTDYDVKKFNEVYHLLTAFSGPLNFCLTRANGQELIWDHLQPYMSDFDFSEMTNMGFHDGFDAPLIPFQLHREALKIQKENFLVILTNDQIAYGGFSFYDMNRNIVVIPSTWEKYEKVSSKFPIGFTIVENILKILLGIEYNPNFYKCKWQGPLQKNNEVSLLDIELKNIKENLAYFLCERFSPNKDNIHNFEIDKDTIEKIIAEHGKAILDLPTTSDGNSTIKIEIEKNVDPKMLVSLLMFYNKLREECSRQVKTPDFKYYDLEIRNNGSIRIPEIQTSIDFEPLQASIYIFFLLYPFNEGIKASDLYKYNKELLEIYETISWQFKAGDKSVTTINSLTRHLPKVLGSFRENKSLINTKITDKIYNPTAMLYRIEGKRMGNLRIDLPKANIKNYVKSLEQILLTLRNKTR